LLATLLLLPRYCYAELRYYRYVEMMKMAIELIRWRDMATLFAAAIGCRHVYASATLHILLVTHEGHWLAMAAC